MPKDVLESHSGAQKLKHAALSAESTVSRNYIDWLWPCRGEALEGNPLHRVRGEVLNTDIRLEKIKERILEFLACASWSRSKGRSSASPAREWAKPPGMSIGRRLGASSCGFRWRDSRRGEIRATAGLHRALPGRSSAHEASRNEEPSFPTRRVDRWLRLRGDPASHCSNCWTGAELHLRPWIWTWTRPFAGVFVATANVIATVPPVCRTAWKFFACKDTRSRKSWRLHGISGEEARAQTGLSEKTCIQG